MEAIRLPIGKMNELFVKCPYCNDKPVEMIAMEHWQTKEVMLFTGGYCGDKKCQPAHDHACDEFDAARKGEL